ncbi:hypothetical protein RB195_013755 [Necator americanus]|uniref:FH2 domain-containing protein n=1 Tax=Necator americanus TaxID=51031 RepID=A0ABR1DXM7_NECAM
MSINTLITGSDNLDEQLSAVEFIKTLRKVDAAADGLKRSQESGESSVSGSSDKVATPKSDDDKKKLIEKKPSASDLLVKMRSRFQHRATEPVFHTITNASEARAASSNSRPEAADQTTP